MIMKEAVLTTDIMDELIRLSIDWEKENSCYGYRANEPDDQELTGAVTVTVDIW